MTSRNPVTWTLGPQRRYPRALPAVESWTIQMQLHNLLPGDTWIPAIETELLTKRTLTALANGGSWRFITANFAWIIHFFLNDLRIQVNHRPTGTQAFIFRFHTAGVRKTVNDILSPASQYAFGGSVVYSWVGVP